MDDGVILIDKPAGWTSFDVVAKIRSQIRAKYRAAGVEPTKRQLRVGHAGTLDPFATGLLIILLGDACKQAGDFLKLDKVYEATFVLGQESTTGDTEGKLKTISGKIPLRDEVEQVSRQFVGVIKQRPPIFSAIKINGQRAYKLARDGQEVEIPMRSVTVHSLEIVDYTYPELKVRTHVGSGTYIRSLAEDIGRAIGCGAYTRELRRTRIGDYSIHEAVGVDYSSIVLTV